MIPKVLLSAGYMNQSAMGSNFELEFKRIHNGQVNDAEYKLRPRKGDALATRFFQGTRRTAEGRQKHRDRTGIVSLKSDRVTPLVLLVGPALDTAAAVNNVSRRSTVRII